MAEFIQNLDPRNIIVIEAVSASLRLFCKEKVLKPPQVLSFVTTPFVAPSYNLPIFLFGVYAIESVESNQSLKLVSRPASVLHLTIYVCCCSFLVWLEPPL